MLFMTIMKLGILKNAQRFKEVNHCHPQESKFLEEAQILFIFWSFFVPYLGVFQKEGMLISGDTSFHNQVGEPLMMCPSKKHNNGILQKKVFKSLGLLRVNWETLILHLRG